MPSGVGELTLLGDPLEGLRRALDAILKIVTIGGQQPDHLVGSAGCGPGYIACGKIDSLSNAVLVLQRLAPSRITRIRGRRASAAARFLYSIVKAEIATKSGMLKI